VRWLLVLVLCLLIFNRFGGWLTRHGFGRLPGDLRFRVGGRELFLPVGSALVLFLVASAIARIR
jgi:hypothetical protein